MKKIDRGLFIRTALKAAGSTMYVFGGGWNDEDTGAGREAVTIGLSGEWKNFFEGCKPDYDFKKAAAPRSAGLDCTGFIGWALYNTLERESGGRGYVFQSGSVGRELEEIGLGRRCESFRGCAAGDILEKKGHAWIFLGSFPDGSVLILHSSPPGVQVNGAPEGSCAHCAADMYMRLFHPRWYEKFPVTHRGCDYLTGYERFSFY